MAVKLAPKVSPRTTAQVPQTHESTPSKKSGNKSVHANKTQSSTQQVKDSLSQKTDKK